MMPMMTPVRQDAMGEWEQVARQIATAAEQIIQAQTRLDLLYTMNDLAKRVTETEPGEIVEGGTMSKEHAQAVVEMMLAFKVFLGTPLPASKIPPVKIIFQR